MSQLELQTCALDRAGVPDLSDLRWVQVETTSIVATTIHIAYDCWADPVQAYPFAAIETQDGLMYCPLEPETDREKLAASVGILRDALGARNASGRSVVSPIGNKRPLHSVSLTSRQDRGTPTDLGGNGPIYVTKGRR